MWEEDIWRRMRLEAVLRQDGHLVHEGLLKAKTSGRSVERERLAFRYRYRASRELDPDFPRGFG